MFSEFSYRVVCNWGVIVVVDEFIWSNMVTVDSYSLRSLMPVCFFFWDVQRSLMPSLVLFDRFCKIKRFNCSILILDGKFPL